MERFGPEVTTYTPETIAVQFKFIAMDPTNGNNIIDYVTVVITSSGESADAECVQYYDYLSWTPIITTAAGT
jgi:hypothetical protein